VVEELRQPLGVLHVGLAPGKDLDMASIDQHELKAAFFEHVPHRLPVLTGRLHHHLGNALRG
jgi:hypothetical protein